MTRLLRLCALLTAFFWSLGIVRATDCNNLPTQFTGNEFPTGDFFSNFQNPCYLISLPRSGTSTTDLNDTSWQIYYKVDPRYQLILVGSYPNARYFSVTAYDDHYLTSQPILDTNIVPLTSSYVNPYQPGVPYASGQQYAVAVNFGGTPGTQETGCMTTGYNVDVNAVDASLRHQGINWNTDPGVFQQVANMPLHVVDTPQHTNPTASGYMLVRAYVDINASDPLTTPAVIVRDVASGCAYPAAYALQTLQIVSTTANPGTWLNQSQTQGHQSYDQAYLPYSCYAADPRATLNWQRDGEFVKFPNPYGTYVQATVPANLPATLASAGEVMRIRLRLPVTPPTPCTNGCSRSGNEQVRYMSLSFYAGGPTIASVPDTAFTRDANGYATLIVGTGASVPAWVTPANGYTFLDLTASSNYQNLLSIQIRNILTAPTFACSSQNVPYKTSVYTPDGSMMGDYLPVIDYPLAGSLPQTATALVGPAACGVLPVGLPAVSPSCGVLPPNPTFIASVPAPAQGQAPVGVQSAPPITLLGSGFGLMPGGLPYSGNLAYLQITDITQGWSAGYTGNACGISIGDWVDSRIELVANVNQNGLCPLAAGDQLAISVWNPQTMTPATTTIWVGAAPTYALASNSATVGSAAGGGSVTLVAGGPWTVAPNASWLHLAGTSAQGEGGALIQYSYDTNTGQAQRTGTLTIAGLTFTVTQAGAGYLPVTQSSVLVGSGLNLPQGVAVDALGNVYIADTGNNAIEVWNPGTGQTTPLAISGLNAPTGVAVDAQGNVYIADSGNHAIQKWTPGGQPVALASGLAQPSGIAADAQGSVFFSDAGNNVVAWIAAGAQPVTLVGSGLTNPAGIAVDALGNVFLADTGGNGVDEWIAGNGQVVAMTVSGLSGPMGLAVDGQGNIYIADSGNRAIRQWNAATGQLLTLASTGLANPTGIAVDAAGNVYVADRDNNAIEKLTFGYLSLSAVNLTEGPQAGADSVTVQTLPANLPVSASSDQAWLSITGVTGGSIGFTFSSNDSGTSRTAHITVMNQQVTVTQTADAVASVLKSAGDGQSTPAGQSFAVPLQVTITDASAMPVSGVPVTFIVNAGQGGAGGTFSPAPPMPVVTDQNGIATAPALTANDVGGPFTVTADAGGLNVTFTLTNLVYLLGAPSATVSSAAGSGTVILTASGPWTASSNASWLAVAPGSQSGAGNAVIQYSYAANTGAAQQTASLNISGATFTVTQAGAAYAPVSQVSSVVTTGLNSPRGIAVNAQGNLYIADSANNAVKAWNAQTQVVGGLLSGLSTPTGVAVDAYGNVYAADSKNNAIKEWNATTQQATTLIGSGLSNPMGVAVDAQGNLYIADTGHNAIKQWAAAGGALTTLISGLNGPRGVAVDALGNVYFAEYNSNDIKEWNAASKQLTTLVASGLSGPYGVAVDGGGNVYIADSVHNAIKEWTAATRQVATLVSTGLKSPDGVAVDAQGGVYIADSSNNAIKKLTTAYLSLGSASRNEGAQAGTDSITYQVLPAGVALTATSDQGWLTITGTGNGAIAFSFKANTSANSRTAHINTWGQKVTVVQAGDTVASVLKTAGNSQSTPVNQVFPTALQVRVKDAAGSVVKGAAVTFTVVAGGNGAAGTFSPAPPMPILTDSSGLATAPALTANGIAGTFKVTATSGTASTTFSLTITQ